MTVDQPAPQGADSRPACVHNAADPGWFRARRIRSSNPEGKTKTWLSRLRGAAWVGTWLTASIGTAIAPTAAEAAGASSRDETATASVETPRPPAEGPGPGDPAPAPADAAETTAPRPAASAGLRASPRLPREEAARPDGGDTLLVGGSRISRSLVETVIRAAEDTEVDPLYMLALADKESSFSAEAKAGTSSAEGLFQFVNSTWLEMIRSHGAKYGYEAAAAAVETVKGELTIANDVMREWVLGLRRDAYLSAVMAGEMLKRDRARVERRIGRDLLRSEYYLIHLLGAASAGKLMEIVGGKREQSAPRTFPQAAKANKNLFFARDGGRTRHLTVGEFYDRLDHMIDTRLDRYIGVSGMHAMLRISL